jgi:hypothetical protein
LAKTALFSQRFIKVKKRVNPTIGFKNDPAIWYIWRMTIRSVSGSTGFGWMTGRPAHRDCAPALPRALKGPVVAPAPAKTLGFLHTRGYVCDTRFFLAAQRGRILRFEFFALNLE